MLGLMGYSSSSDDDDNGYRSQSQSQQRLQQQHPPPQPISAAVREQLLAASSSFIQESPDSDSDGDRDGLGLGYGLGASAGASGATVDAGRGGLGGLFSSLPAPKRPDHKSDTKKHKEAKKEKKKAAKKDKNDKKNRKKENKRRRSTGPDSDGDGEVQDGVVEGGEIVQDSKRGRFELGIHATPHAPPRDAVAASGLAVELLPEDQGPALPPEFHEADLYAVRHDDGSAPQWSHGYSFPGVHADAHGRSDAQQEVPAAAELKGRWAREFQSAGRLVDVDQGQLLQLSETDLAKLREEQELIERYRQLNPDAKHVPVPGKPDVKVSKLAKSKNQIGALVAHAQTMELELLRRSQRRAQGRANARLRHGF